VARSAAPLAATAGFIANTDFGWFSHFLHRAEPPDVVDFWQPSPHGFKAIPPGAPSLYRMRSPATSAPSCSTGMRQRCSGG